MRSVDPFLAVSAIDGEEVGRGNSVKLADTPISSGGDLSPEVNLTLSRRNLPISLVRDLF